MAASARKSKKYRELVARMNESSTRTQRTGTYAWVENHKESELIKTLIAEHAKRRAQGGGLSHDEFIQRVLVPEFDYPFEGGAFRNYVAKYHGQKGKKRGR